MSRSYRVVVEIEGIGPGRMDAVGRAVGETWEYNSGYDDPEEGSFRFTGYEDLNAGYPPARFAEDLSRATWEANGEYCPVAVEVTDEEDLGRDEYEFTRADYDRSMRFGPDAVESAGPVPIDSPPGDEVRARGDVRPDGPDGAPPLA